MNNRDAGRLGEMLAVNFLLRRGLRIVERNWRSHAGEIDIICDDQGTLVFVEVKTRTDDSFGPPCAAVTAAKQQRLRRLAEEYLSQKGITETAVRFDVVGVKLERVISLDYIKGAF